MKHALIRSFFRPLLAGLFILVFSSHAMDIPIADEFQEEKIATQENRNFIIIPLGCNCQPAHYLRLHDLRPFALPFDWCITPYRALYNCINNDFKDYLKKEHLTAPTKTLFSQYQQDFFNRLGYRDQDFACPGWVYDQASGMVHNHDFPDNAAETINQYHAYQHAKYMRRIKRVYDALNSDKKIYLIRYFDITKAEACALCQLIKEKFPSADFTLIIIGNNRQEFEKEWGIPHIKNFFIEHADSFWAQLCRDIAAGKL